MSTDIKAILFDKDGTLLDFDATWTPAFETAALLAAGGVTELAGTLLSSTGLDPATGKSAAGSLLAAGNSAELAAAWIALGARYEPEQLSRELDRIFVRRMHDARPLPGLETAIVSLSGKGYLLGVASSDSEAAIRAFLEGTGLAAWFRFVTGYDTGHGPKPEPGMVFGFADALGISPSNVAVIGDNTHDLEMARAAGAGLAIGVLTGTSGRHDLEPLADAVLDSAADLVGFLPS